MSNMSYCRFQNTLLDLGDCEDALETDWEDMSEDEAKARDRLIAMCKRIARNYASGDDE